jgi:hypothetical protein
MDDNSIDFSFLSVTSGSVSGSYRGIDFTYRIPTAQEEDEFTSIQFRQLTEGRSLTDTIANRGKESKSSDKVIPFSKLALRRFQTLCTGWEPTFKVNGEDLTFSPASVDKIVKELPKLAQQVDSIVWGKYSETLEEEQGN